MCATFSDYTAQDLERFYPETDARSGNDKRGPFERDRARIVHSAAFRRLQGKTQVYGLGASDYYRTRLTHSLEVAQIGKALALRLDADPTLVEAICLAHDIGHPPFGHAGEYALHEAMEDVDGFNGNAQNIRILIETEFKSEQYRGLNLTKATLDGLIKYPNVIDPPHGVKKGYYRQDADFISELRGNSTERTFECELMNWADDVAYSSHDLEDAIAIGTVRAEDLTSDDKKDRIFAKATESYGKDYPDLDAARRITAQDVEEAVAGILRYCFESSTNRLAKIKSFVANHIDHCVTSPISEDRSHLLRRYSRRVKLDGDLARRVEIYKAITMTCVIFTNPVLTLQRAGRRVVTELYEAYSDIENPNVRYYYPDDWSVLVERALTAARTVNNLAFKRLARDYLATMTDRFAEEQWRRLNLPGEGTLFIARA